GTPAGGFALGPGTPPAGFPPAARVVRPGVSAAEAAAHGTAVIRTPSGMEVVSRTPVPGFGQEDDDLGRAEPPLVDGVRRYTAEDDDEPDEDDEPRAEQDDDEADEPRTSSRLVRTIVVTVLAIMVAGSVAGAAVSRAPDQERLDPGTPSVLPIAMDGATVLRPHLIAAELGRGTTVPTQASVPPRPAGPLAPRDAAERFVMDFYGLLPRRAPEAFGYLAPAMHGEGRQAFVADWNQAAYVHRVILPSEDDAVHISITVSRTDQVEVIRLVQRVEVQAVTVDGRPQLQIVGAQLLSAHRN
ncbi:MAG TPA: hypothetical protein VGD67_00330, partial [Pseudonocardiaceae bacterium]